MKHAVAALLLLLGLANAAAAQSGKPISDAELEVFCSFDALVPTGLGSAKVQQELDDLALNERSAQDKLKDPKLSATLRAETLDFLADVPAQRKALEQTLQDLISSEAARPAVQSCLDPMARESFCGAYRAGRAISWDVAAGISSCMQKSMQASNAALRAPKSVAPSETARALTGTSLETAILRGTAEFIVARGEQELAMFAAQVMTSELCDTPTVASLLKRTCALIAEPNDDISEDDPVFAVTLAALHEAVRADLDALPIWLSTKLSEQSKTKPAACALQIAWGFSQRVLQGADVAETLWDLQSIVDEVKAEDACSQDPQFIPRLTQLLAALRAVPRLQGVDVDGLMRSGGFDLLVSRTARGLTTSRNGETELTPDGSLLREVLRRVRELQRAIAMVEKDPTGPKRAAAVIAALRTVEPLLRHAGAKEYIATISALVESIGSQQYIAAVIALAESTLLEDALGPTRVGRNFHVLISLSATIAQAESSEAVKTALEEASAPLQSWRRKDIKRWGATITGLPGFGFAYELPVEKTSSEERAPAGTTFAPTLMLGVDVHHGLGSSRVGLLLNVLDLGAVATIRLSNPAPAANQAPAEREPEIRFEQVFAPGLYPYFGIGPFDIGVGVGFVPSLRPARDDESRAIQPLDVLRFGAFVAVDVSVLPVF